MRTLNGLGMSLLLALIGAAIWVALALAIDLRLWIILAAGVGVLAGYGMSIGTKGEGGSGNGVLAAIVCLLVCLGAQGFITHHYTVEYVREVSAVTDDDAYEEICSQTYNAWLEDGLIEPSWSEDYPDAVYQSADEQWGAMTDDQREDYKASLASQWTGGADAQAVTGFAWMIVFFLSLLGWLPIACLASAVGSAYRFGSFIKDPEDTEIPQWALGQSASSPTGAGDLHGVASSPAGTPQGAPASVAGVAPALAPSAPRASAGASNRIGEPQDAAASFWNRLGSDSPARTTPSLRRTPRRVDAPGAAQSPASPAGDQPPQSQAA